VNTGGEIVEPTDDNTFVKVTDEGQIAVGNHYILVNEAAGVAAGELNSKYLEAVEVEMGDGTAVIDPTEVTVFTLGGNAAGYSLMNAAGEYLTTYEDRKLQYAGTASPVWEINYSMSAEGFIVESEDFGKIQYNKDVPRFLNYMSAQSAAVLYVSESSQGGGGETPVDPVIDPSGGDVVAGEGKFKLVESNSDLEPNRNYLIVYQASETAGVALSGVTNNIGGKVDVDIENNIIDNTKAGAATVALLDGGNGRWLMKLGDGYLQYDKPVGTKSNNYLYVTDDASDAGTLWIVSATDGITNAFNTERKLQYNKSSNGLRFCCYMGTQQDVTLYKEIVTTTGVDELPSPFIHHPSAIYDLSGRRLQNVSIHQLPKGIYIMVGKKYVVK
jgi:hypothetical protein